MVRDFVRLVAELKARTFVFENVKGLTVGKHKAFLVELVETFEDAGYSVRTPWRVLNAGHYGTPQSRERLIVLGARRGVTVPEYPEPTTDIAGSRNPLIGMPIGPTCGQALGDVPDADGFAGLLHKDETRTIAFGKPSAYAKEMRCLSNDAWHFGYVRNWDRSMLTSSTRTGHTEISRRRFAQTVPGTVEPISRFFRLPEDGVSNTLRAGTDGSRGAFTSPRPIHYRYPRCITVREMARLHGFPRLVSVTCNEVAWRAANWKRCTAATGQSHCRRSNGSRRRYSPLAPIVPSIWEILISSGSIFQVRHDILASSPLRTGVIERAVRKSANRSISRSSD